MAKYKVDIIIPCYNYGCFLDECVTSVLSQSFNDFRVLLIDNASTDDTQVRAENWKRKDDRIQYVRNERNIGFHGSIKKAISLTDAGLIVILPVDDLWEKDFLKETVFGLNNYPEVAMAYTRWDRFREVKDERKPLQSVLIPHRGSGVVEDRDLLISHNWIPLSFGVFRRKYFEEVGGLRDTLSQTSDYELWLKMSVRWSFYFCDHLLGYIREHDRNWSKSLISSGKCSDEYIDIDDRIFADQNIWPEHTRFLVKARQIRRLTGMSMGRIAQAMVGDAESLHKERLKGCKADFLYAVAEMILKNNHLIGSQEQDGRAFYGTQEEGLKLLEDCLDEVPRHEKATQLYNDYKSDHDSRYYKTWMQKHTLEEIHGQVFAERMMLKWQIRPVIHLVMILQRSEEDLLADTIDSLSAQMYKNWRLTVLAEFPPPDSVFDDLDALEWLQVDAATDLHGMINQAVTRGKADWIAFVEAGIRFAPQCLFTCVDYIHIRPQWRLIYTDEDLIDVEGRRFDPKFKPDFNLDMLRSMPYFGGFCLVRRKELEEVGGYDAMPRVENYDLAFKILDHCSEGAIGHIADVLFHLPDWSHCQVDEKLGRVALMRHLQRKQIEAEVVFGSLPGTYRVVYHHEVSPLVSIIIPTKDKLEIFQPCIETLLEKTTYPHYEVIVVDNNSSDPDTLDFYHILEKRYPSKIKILRYPNEFNFSAICNYGVKEAKGEYLVLLNNDTEVIQAEWLERMMMHGQRKEVGAVGARLIYPESGKIQHAGVILGLSDVADHPYNGLLGINDPGYMGRAQIDQNFSAVTAACMLVRKSVYKEVGGMDEENTKVLFNDVDLCLKMIKRSFKVVWTPYATLSHHGSQTLKSEALDAVKVAPQIIRSRKEVAFMRKKWLPLLANDPAYNPQLSLVNLDFRVESHVVVNWDCNFHDRPRIFGLPLSFGSGEYRVISPGRALSTAAIAHFDFVRPVKSDEMRILEVSELQRAAPDTLLVQNAISDKQIDALRLYKENHHALRVFALDDLMTQLPEKNSFYRKVHRDAKPRLRKALGYCDRLIVSTEPLAELCRTMIDDIRVIPNRLEKTKWCDLVSKRRQGKKPRVGWVGAQQHQGDLELIISVVKETAAEVDWVFMGMCLDEMRPHLKEMHDFVSFEDYPAKVASLNLDLAIAPLEMNPFNEAKSNLRLLEYGVFGWPVVCTDIVPYQNAPVKRVQNNPENWIAAILERTNNLDVAEAEGDILKKWVMENYLLEDHLDSWAKALLR